MSIQTLVRLERFSISCIKLHSYLLLKTIYLYTSHTIIYLNITHIFEFFLRHAYVIISHQDSFGQARTDHIHKVHH